MTDTSKADPPPQTNGIDNDADDDERGKMRPADIDADMREMERRKRVEMIMNSRLFREELERIIEIQMKDGGNGPAGLLQQISDIMGGRINPTGMFKSSNCVVPINDIRGVESMGYAKGEKLLRCKLAAVYRLIDLYGWAQGINNLITARLNQEEEHFIANPHGMLYHELTASSLVKLDMQGNVVESGTTNFPVNNEAFQLHAAVHAARPDIKCVIHVHTPSLLAVSSCLSGLLPISQEAVSVGEVSYHPFFLSVDAEEKDKIGRSLGPINKVMFIANKGALCCGETVEEAFFNVYNTVVASETQLKLGPTVSIDNVRVIPEEARKPGSNKTAAIQFEALMRMLDNAGFRTGYIYRQPLVKGELPRPRNDVEVPPAVSSLGYLLEEEEMYKQGQWKRYADGRKSHDRTRWLNSPNVYQKVEILETGTPDPKKITKWVDANAEEWVVDGSPTHSSTPVKIDSALQFVPKNTHPKEFKLLQKQIKENRRADKITSGPQSHILEGVSWEEAKKLQDANVTETGDQVIVVGAASKGIIQREFQHHATVYKTPYAKNPFDTVTDQELEDYKKVVTRKQKGEYSYDDSESEGFSSSAALPPSGRGFISETEDDSRGEARVLRIETKQVPRASKAEVVLSDALTPALKNSDSGLSVLPSSQPKDNDLEPSYSSDVVTVFYAPSKISSTIVSLPPDDNAHHLSHREKLHNIHLELTERFTISHDLGSGSLLPKSSQLVKMCRDNLNKICDSESFEKDSLSLGIPSSSFASEILPISKSGYVKDSLDSDDVHGVSSSCALKDSLDDAPLIASSSSVESLPADGESDPVNDISTFIAYQGTVFDLNSSQTSSCPDRSSDNEATLEDGDNSDSVFESNCPLCNKWCDHPKLGLSPCTSNESQKTCKLSKEDFDVGFKVGSFDSCKSTPPESEADDLDSSYQNYNIFDCDDYPVMQAKCAIVEPVQPSINVSASKLPKLSTITEESHADEDKSSDQKKEEENFSKYFAKLVATNNMSPEEKQTSSSGSDDSPLCDEFYPFSSGNEVSVESSKNRCREPAVSHLKLSAANNSNTNCDCNFTSRRKSCPSSHCEYLVESNEPREVVSDTALSSYKESSGERYDSVALNTDSESPELTQSKESVSKKASLSTTTELSSEGAFESPEQHCKISPIDANKNVSETIHSSVNVVCGASDCEGNSKISFDDDDSIEVIFPPKESSDNISIQVIFEQNKSESPSSNQEKTAEDDSSSNSNSSESSALVGCQTSLSQNICCDLKLQRKHCVCARSESEADNISTDENIDDHHFSIQSSTCEDTEMSGRKGVSDNVFSTYSSSSGVADDLLIKDALSPDCQNLRRDSPLLGQLFSDSFSSDPQEYHTNKSSVNSDFSVVGKQTESDIPAGKLCARSISDVLLGEDASFNLKSSASSDLDESIQAPLCYDTNILKNPPACANSESDADFESESEILSDLNMLFNPFSSIEGPACANSESDAGSEMSDSESEILSDLNMLFNPFGSIDDFSGSGSYVIGSEYHVDENVSIPMVASISSHENENQCISTSNDIQDDHQIKSFNPDVVRDSCVPADNGSEPKATLIGSVIKVESNVPDVSSNMKHFCESTDIVSEPKATHISPTIKLESDALNGLNNVKDSCASADGFSEAKVSVINPVIKLEKDVSNNVLTATENSSLISSSVRYDSFISSMDTKNALVSAVDASFLSTEGETKKTSTPVSIGSTSRIVSETEDMIVLKEVQKLAADEDILEKQYVNAPLVESTLEEFRSPEMFCSSQSEPNNKDETEESESSSDAKSLDEAKSGSNTDDESVQIVSSDGSRSTYEEKLSPHTDDETAQSESSQDSRLTDEEKPASSDRNTEFSDEPSDSLALFETCGDFPSGSLPCAMSVLPVATLAHNSDQFVATTMNILGTILIDDHANGTENSTSVAMKNDGVSPEDTNFEHSSDESDTEGDESLQKFKCEQSFGGYLLKMSSSPVSSEVKNNEPETCKIHSESASKGYSSSVDHSDVISLPSKDRMLDHSESKCNESYENDANKGENLPIHTEVPPCIKLPCEFKMSSLKTDKFTPFSDFSEPEEFPFTMFPECTKSLKISETPLISCSSKFLSSKDIISSSAEALSDESQDSASGSVSLNELSDESTQSSEENFPEEFPFSVFPKGMKSLKISETSLMSCPSKYLSREDVISSSAKAPQDESQDSASSSVSLNEISDESSQSSEENFPEEFPFSVFPKGMKSLKISETSLMSCPSKYLSREDVISSSAKAPQDESQDSASSSVSLNEPSDESAQISEENFQEDSSVVFVAESAKQCESTIEIFSEDSETDKGDAWKESFRCKSVKQPNYGKQSLPSPEVECVAILSEENVCTEAPSLGENFSKEFLKDQSVDNFKKVSEVKEKHEFFHCSLIEEHENDEQSIDESCQDESCALLSGVLTSSSTSPPRFEILTDETSEEQITVDPVYNRHMKKSDSDEEKFREHFQDESSNVLTKEEITSLTSAPVIELSIGKTSEQSITVDPIFDVLENQNEKNQENLQDNCQDESCVVLSGEEIPSHTSPPVIELSTGETSEESITVDPIFDVHENQNEKNQRNLQNNCQDESCVVLSGEEIPSHTSFSVIELSIGKTSEQSITVDPIFDVLENQNEKNQENLQDNRQDESCVVLSGEEIPSHTSPPVIELSTGETSEESITVDPIFDVHENQNEKNQRNLQNNCQDESCVVLSGEEIPSHTSFSVIELSIGKTSEQSITVDPIFDVLENQNEKNQENLLDNCQDESCVVLSGEEIPSHTSPPVIELSTGGTSEESITVNPVFVVHENQNEKNQGNLQGNCQDESCVVLSGEEIPSYAHFPVIKLSTAKSSEECIIVDPLFNKHAEHDENNAKNSEENCQDESCVVLPGAPTASNFSPPRSELLPGESLIDQNVADPIFDADVGERDIDEPKLEDIRGDDSCVILSGVETPSSSAQPRLEPLPDESCEEQDSVNLIFHSCVEERIFNDLKAEENQEDGSCIVLSREEIPINDFPLIELSSGESSEEQFTVDSVFNARAGKDENNANNLKENRQDESCTVLPGEQTPNSALPPRSETLPGKSTEENTADPILNTYVEDSENKEPKLEEYFHKETCIVLSEGEISISASFPKIELPIDEPPKEQISVNTPFKANARKGPESPSNALATEDTDGTKEVLEDSFQKGGRAVLPGEQTPKTFSPPLNENSLSATITLSDELRTLDVSVDKSELFSFCKSSEQPAPEGTLESVDYDEVCMPSFCEKTFTVLPDAIKEPTLKTQNQKTEEDCSLPIQTIPEEDNVNSVSEKYCFQGHNAFNEGPIIFRCSNENIMASGSVNSLLKNHDASLKEPTIDNEHPAPINLEPRAMSSFESLACKFGFGNIDFDKNNFRNSVFEEYIKSSESCNSAFEEYLKSSDSRSSAFEECIKSSDFRNSAFGERIKSSCSAADTTKSHNSFLSYLSLEAHMKAEPISSFFQQTISSLEQSSDSAYQTCEGIQMLDGDGIFKASENILMGNSCGETSHFTVVSNQGSANENVLIHGTDPQEIDMETENHNDLLPITETIKMEKIDLSDMKIERSSKTEPSASTVKTHEYKPPRKKKKIEGRNLTEDEHKMLSGTENISVSVGMPFVAKEEAMSNIHVTYDLVSKEIKVNPVSSHGSDLDVSSGHSQELRDSVLSQNSPEIAINLNSEKLEDFANNHHPQASTVEFRSDTDLKPVNECISEVIDFIRDISSDHEVESIDSQEVVNACNMIISDSLRDNNESSEEVSEDESSSRNSADTSESDNIESSGEVTEDYISSSNSADTLERMRQCPNDQSSGGDSISEESEKCEIRHPVQPTPHVFLADAFVNGNPTFSQATDSRNISNENMSPPSKETGKPSCLNSQDPICEMEVSTSPIPGSLQSHEEMEVEYPCISVSECAADTKTEGANDFSESCAVSVFISSVGDFGFSSEFNDQDRGQSIIDISTDDGIDTQLQTFDDPCAVISVNLDPSLNETFDLSDSLESCNDSNASIIDSINGSLNDSVDNPKGSDAEMLQELTDPVAIEPDNSNLNIYPAHTQENVSGPEEHPFEGSQKNYPPRFTLKKKYCKVRSMKNIPSFKSNPPFDFARDDGFFCGVPVTSTNSPFSNVKLSGQECYPNSTQSWQTKKIINIDDKVILSGLNPEILPDQFRPKAGSGRIRQHKSQVHKSSSCKIQVDRNANVVAQKSSKKMSDSEGRWQSFCHNLKKNQLQMNPLQLKYFFTNESASLAFSEPQRAGVDSDKNTCLSSCLEYNQPSKKIEQSNSEDSGLAKDEQNQSLCLQVKSSCKEAKLKDGSMSEDTAENLNPSAFEQLDDTPISVVGGEQQVMASNRQNECSHSIVTFSCEREKIPITVYHSKPEHVVEDSDNGPSLEWKHQFQGTMESNHENSEAANSRQQYHPGQEVSFCRIIQPESDGDSHFTCCSEQKLPLEETKMSDNDSCKENEHQCMEVAFSCRRRRASIMETHHSKPGYSREKLDRSFCADVEHLSGGTQVSDDEVSEAATSRRKYQSSQEITFSPRRVVNPTLQDRQPRSEMSPDETDLSSYSEYELLSDEASVTESEDLIAVTNRKSTDDENLNLGINRQSSENENLELVIDRQPSDDEDSKVVTGKQPSCRAVTFHFERDVVPIVISDPLSRDSKSKTVDRKLSEVIEDVQHESIRPDVIIFCERANMPAPEDPLPALKSSSKDLVPLSFSGVPKKLVEEIEAGDNEGLQGIQNFNRASCLGFVSYQERQEILTQEDNQENSTNFDSNSDQNFSVTREENQPSSSKALDCIEMAEDQEQLSICCPTILLNTEHCDVKINTQIKIRQNADDSFKLDFRHNLCNSGQENVSIENVGDPDLSPPYPGIESDETLSSIPCDRREKTEIMNTGSFGALQKTSEKRSPSCNRTWKSLKVPGIICENSPFRASEKKNILSIENFNKEDRFFKARTHCVKTLNEAFEEKNPEVRTKTPNIKTRCIGTSNETLLDRTPMTETRCVGTSIEAFLGGFPRVETLTIKRGGETHADRTPTVKTHSVGASNESLANRNLRDETHSFGTANETHAGRISRIKTHSVVAANVPKSRRRLLEIGFNEAPSNSPRRPSIVVSKKTLTFHKSSPKMVKPKVSSKNLSPKMSTEEKPRQKALRIRQSSSSSLDDVKSSKLKATSVEAANVLKNRRRPPEIGFKEVPSKSSRRPSLVVSKKSLTFYKSSPKMVKPKVSSKSVSPKMSTVEKPQQKALRIRQSSSSSLDDVKNPKLKAASVEASNQEPGSKYTPLSEIVNQFISEQNLDDAPPSVKASYLVSSRRYTPALDTLNATQLRPEQNSGMSPSVGGSSQVPSRKCVPILKTVKASQFLQEQKSDEKSSPGKATNIPSSKNCTLMQKIPTTSQRFHEQNSGDSSSSEMEVRRSSGDFTALHSDSPENYHKRMNSLPGSKRSWENYRERVNSLPSSKRSWENWFFKDRENCHPEHNVVTASNISRTTVLPEEPYSLICALGSVRPKGRDHTIREAPIKKEGCPTITDMPREDRSLVVQEDSSNSLGCASETEYTLSFQFSKPNKSLLGKVAKKICAKFGQKTQPKSDSKLGSSDCSKTKGRLHGGASFSDEGETNECSFYEDLKDDVDSYVSLEAASSSNCSEAWDTAPTSDAENENDLTLVNSDTYHTEISDPRLADMSLKNCVERQAVISPPPYTPASPKNITVTCSPSFDSKKTSEKYFTEQTCASSESSRQRYRDSELLNLSSSLEEYRELENYCVLSSVVEPMEKLSAQNP